MKEYISERIVEQIITVPVPQVMEEIVEVCKVIPQEHIPQCTVVEWIQEQVLETIKVIAQDMKVLMQKDFQQLSSLDRSESENLPKLYYKQLCRDVELNVLNESRRLSMHDTGWNRTSGSMHQQHTSGQAVQEQREEERRKKKGKGVRTDEEGLEKLRKKERRNEGEEVEREHKDKERVEKPRGDKRKEGRVKEKETREGGARSQRRKKRVGKREKKGRKKESARQKCSK